VRYLTHILPDTVSCDPEKIQACFIGNTFAIRDEKVVELNSLADESPCKVTETTGARKRTGLQYIFFGSSAVLCSGSVMRFSLCTYNIVKNSRISQHISRFLSYRSRTNEIFNWNHADTSRYCYIPPRDSITIKAPQPISVSKNEIINIKNGVDPITVRILIHYGDIFENHYQMVIRAFYIAKETIWSYDNIENKLEIKWQDYH
jgi:hypothetical protein